MPQRTAPDLSASTEITERNSIASSETGVRCAHRCPRRSMPPLRSRSFCTRAPDERRPPEARTGQALSLLGQTNSATLHLAGSAATSSPMEVSESRFRIGRRRIRSKRVGARGIRQASRDPDRAQRGRRREPAVSIAHPLPTPNPRPPFVAAVSPCTSTRQVGRHDPSDSAGRQITDQHDAWECPRNCVGPSERDRYAYDYEKQDAEQQGQGEAGPGA